MRRLGITKDVERHIAEGVDRLFILSHPVRLRILWLLRQYENGLSIVDIQRKLNKESKKEYVYKNYIKHLKVLKKGGYVQMEKQKKVKGRPVIVKLNPKVLPIMLEEGNARYTILPKYLF